MRMGNTVECLYDSTEWPSLPATERVSRCRLWAAQARKYALKAGGSHRQMYLSIANGWDALALEIERERPTRSD